MEYHEIHEEMTIGDLVKSGAYGVFADYIFTYMTPDRWNSKLKDYGFEKVGFEECLHRMEELAAFDGKQGETFIHSVYPEEVLQQEWDKKDVKLIHFPLKEKGEAKPYVLILPGGGFNRQWGLIEGMAIAAHLNTLGYPAFVLFYRVKQDGVLKMEIEDMHNALRYIDKHAKDFHVLSDTYMLGGFSAGATIAAEIGTEKFGWRAAHLAKPGLLFLGYPAVSMTGMYQTYTAAEEKPEVQQALAVVMRRIAGPVFRREIFEELDILENLSKECPPVLLVANKDDTTVDIGNAYGMIQACEANGICCKSIVGEKGNHGFGLGNGLPVQGWLEKAVEVWRSGEEE